MAPTGILLQKSRQLGLDPNSVSGLELVRLSEVVIKAIHNLLLSETEKLTTDSLRIISSDLAQILVFLSDEHRIGALPAVRPFTEIIKVARNEIMSATLLLEYGRRTETFYRRISHSTDYLSKALDYLKISINCTVKVDISFNRDKRQLTTESNPSSRKRKTMNRPQSIKILFLAANPLDSTRLRLDEEIRSIDQSLRQAEFRDRFDIKQHWAVRLMDIQSYLLRHKPDIIHFSGHGEYSSEIVLEDNSGYSRPVPIRALSQLFSVLRDNIRCIVLNACYSEEQAKSIAEHIDCVVGMSKAIGDAAAISFASSFYQALGYGRDIKTAFDLGCIQIDLENLDEQDTPKLISIKADPRAITFINDG